MQRGEKLEKLVKSEKIWGKVAKSGEKWEKVVKSGEKWKKLGKKVTETLCTEDFGRTGSAQYVGASPGETYSGRECLFGAVDSYSPDEFLLCILNNCVMITLLK